MRRDSERLLGGLTFDSRRFLYKRQCCRSAASHPLSGLQGGYTMANHNVNFDNTDANWLAWGKLVNDWVDHPANRPNKVSELRTQMTTAGITGIVLVGTDNRPVNVNTYNSDASGPLVIPVPTQAMVAADTAYLDGIAPAAYPLPSFYSTIFGGTSGVTLTKNMLELMQFRRLGEYVINECM
jgi:hypothetical protein